jgi:hypothetical protein
MRLIQESFDIAEMASRMGETQIGSESRQEINAEANGYGGFVNNNRIFVRSIASQ